MSELEWITVASRALRYCAELLQQIRQLKDTLQRAEDETTRLKTLVQQLETQHGGYNTVR